MERWWNDTDKGKWSVVGMILTGGVERWWNDTDGRMEHWWNDTDGGSGALVE